MSPALTEYVLRDENLLIVAAVWFLLSTIKRAMPTLTQHRIWARLEPLLPMVLCSAAVWVPEAVDGSTLDRLLLGVILGAMAANGHKIFKQTGLGDDSRIRKRGVF